MNSFNDIEEKIRAEAPLLPSHLRHRVLVRCAAERRQHQVKRQRANWRLAIGFTVVFSLHWIVGGTLEAQQQELLGHPASTTGLYASTREINPAELQLNMMLRARLLAELADPQLNRF
jgi:hypothetical protein